MLELINAVLTFFTLLLFAWFVSLEAPEPPQQDLWPVSAAELRLELWEQDCPELPYTTPEAAEIY